MAVRIPGECRVNSTPQGVYQTTGSAQNLCTHRQGPAVISYAASARRGVTVDVPRAHKLMGANGVVSPKTGVSTPCHCGCNSR